MPVSVELEKLSNEDLAEECARRPVNEGSWREFWQRFHPLVYRKVLNLLAPFVKKPIHSEVDDVVQLVFLNIFRRLSNFDRQKSPLTAYLSLITTSTVIDELRRAQKKNTVPLEELHGLVGDLQTGIIEADELWRTVVSVLQSADPRDQSVIKELVSGDSREAIAARHRITTSLVYTITYRFRQALKAALEKPAK